MAEQAMILANNIAWSGRTGSSDRAVFIAHAQLAHRAGRINYAASVRDLAQRAGVSRITASRANHRLIETGFLKLVRKATGDCAQVFRLTFSLSYHEDKSGQDVTLPHRRGVRKCHTLSDGLCNHDAFRFQGLGKSACEVYEALLKQPATVEELIASTGRHKRTVKRALERMTGLVDVRTGEIVDMAYFDGEIWHAVEVDLDQVAEIVGTAGKGDAQRRRHERERAMHSRWLAANIEANEEADGS